MTNMNNNWNKNVTTTNIWMNIRIRLEDNTINSNNQNQRFNKTPAEERDIFRPELFYNYINEAQE